LKQLVISFEWGAIRLIRALHDRGVAVAALCSSYHAMTPTSFLSWRFPLEDVKAVKGDVRRRPPAALAETVARPR
jgi:hypothetical protein